jgi:hypothetical protein
MTPIPCPRELELRAPPNRGRAPRVPFGLAVWSPQASSIAILLDASERDLDDASSVAEQIPRAGDLPPATGVYVLSPGIAHRHGLARWLGPRHVRASRAARCGALLMRGYVGIQAGVDPSSGLDIVYGVSSLSSELPPACPQSLRGLASTP